MKREKLFGWGITIMGKQNSKSFGLFASNFLVRIAMPMFITGTYIKSTNSVKCNVEAVNEIKLGILAASGGKNVRVFIEVVLRDW